MKKLTVIALFLSVLTVNGQGVLGTGVGYSVGKSAVMNLQAGMKFNNSHLYYNQLIHLTRASDIPQIFGVRYGYNIGSFQPHIGYDYHLGNTDIKNNKVSGWRFGYGVTKYFPECPLMISVSRSGKYTFLVAGFYKVLQN